MVAVVAGDNSALCVHQHHAESNHRGAARRYGHLPGRLDGGLQQRCLPLLNDPG
jgi:predicted ABC-type transport system involved in lysophospholipase L1 biosynthesis ATPase subunit